ncbi:hypothetical protein GCM10027418_06710 [Mariniluteicoccus endophyticus]
MAYTATKSYGYPGSMPTDAYSRASVFFGSDYAVGGPGDLKITPTAGDRAVSIAAGTAYGKGIMDVFDAGTLSLPSVASGQQWFAIVARRDWASLTGSTTIDYRPGDQFDRLPTLDKLSATMLKDDQPLALVQVVAGQTHVGTIIDLRSFPSKVAVIGDLRGWPDAPVGARAIVNDVEYRRVLDRNSQPVWAPSAARTWRGQIWNGQADGASVAPGRSMLAPPIRQATGELARCTTMDPGPAWSGAGKAMTPPTPGTYRLTWRPKWVGASDPTALAWAQIRVNPKFDPQGWDAGDPMRADIGMRIAEDVAPMNGSIPSADAEYEFGPGDRFLLLTWHDATTAKLAWYPVHSWFSMTRLS